MRCPDVDRSDPPEVGIALGSNINGDEVKEGDDLYIECHIRANPPFHKLQWTHNVSPVSPTVLSFLPFRPCLNGFLYICTAGCDDGACRPMNPFREWELSLSLCKAGNSLPFSLDPFSSYCQKDQVTFLSFVRTFLFLSSESLGRDRDALSRRGNIILAVFKQASAHLQFPVHNCLQRRRQSSLPQRS